MDRHRRAYRRLTAAALQPEASVRYHYRDGSSLATVVDRTDQYVTFVGLDCDGRFTHDQIETLLEDGRLEVVLDDDTHVPAETLSRRF
ncbi:hypothetical protein D8Y22_09795 [Salinadaptatus halalkaliphilus]|uniref:Uncharacterized protein n=1 Tax=Salinadaptatus halalkaliphilus TaxID=2419781 RepID=A0A4S3TP29_9EURY|nr:hypothetical protein [Salinadaptatus halalkaliphilus]THE64905.1 hypothetical protein D8Y22_09795 [Salinadaptatus halalkaliphilus]